MARPMQCFDWNAVNFGNDCVIDGLLQFHTFENMMLKVKRTHIQDGCTVAFGATVMGGAVIERDTTLLPLSLVLKEMNLLTATYEGSPAELVSGSTLLPDVSPVIRGKMASVESLAQPRQTTEPITKSRPDSPPHSKRRVHSVSIVALADRRK